jgi:hypothetical protein
MEIEDLRDPFFRNGGVERVAAAIMTQIESMFSRALQVEIRRFSWRLSHSNLIEGGGSGARSVVG